MSLLLSVLGWVLLGALCVLVLAMVTPLRLELSVRKDARWLAIAVLRPFGRFGPRVVLRRGKPADKARDKAEKTAPKKPRRRKRMRRVDMATAVLRLITDILARIRIASMRIDVQFGLGDPAETGQVFGYAAPLIHGARALPGVSVTARPVFDRACLTGAADVDLTVVPAKLLAPAARFGWALLGPSG